jgi:hypothetical protein
MNSLIFDLVATNSDLSIADIVNYSHTSASNRDMIKNMQIYPKQKNIYIYNNNKLSSTATYIKYSSLLSIDPNNIIYDMILKNGYELFINNSAANDNKTFLTDINNNYPCWRLITAMTICIIENSEIDLQYFINLKKLTILKRSKDMFKNIPRFCKVTYI